MPVLTDLCACDRGVSPTNWQREQLPREFRDRVDVIPDGVDTVFYAPAETTTGLALPRAGISLPPDAELVTTLATGTGSRHGLPLFLDLLEDLFEKRPAAHAVVAGPRLLTGRGRSAGNPPWAEELLAGRRLDANRVHFTGPLDLADYRRVLQASRLHLHLGGQQVLPGSVLEALAAGCLLLAVDHPALREVVRHGENGLLASSAERVSLLAHSLDALERGAELDSLRLNARRSVLEGYALREVLPRQVAWIESCLG